MERYSEITQKFKREIVLLKARPCVWSKCTFCDYIEDNSKCKEEMLRINNEVLDQVTGKYGVLEVIDSASIFELPRESWKKIKEVIDAKHIHTLFVESHWIFHDRIQEIKDYFGIRVIIKTGVESFDDHFRNVVLNKNAHFSSIEELKQYCDSPCMMVGIKGQTKEMIIHDMTTLMNNFDLGTISVYRNNSTSIKRDDELVQWFMNEYGYLKDDPRYDFLYEPTDFGVGN